MADEREVREDGPYWVKVFKGYPWKIGYWDNKNRVWRFVNSMCECTNVYKVGPKMLPPKEEKKEREPGFYWVKGEYNKVWDIAQWVYPDWYYKYATKSFKDEHFSKIGPRMSPPSE